LNAQRDVQIELVLPLEVEGLPRHLEKGEARAVIHREEGVEALAFADLKGAHQLQPKKILVEAPRFVGVAAAIGVVVQAFDHRNPLVDPRARVRENYGAVCSCLIPGSNRRPGEGRTRYETAR